MAIRVANKITFIHISQSAGTSVCKFLRKNFPYEDYGKQHSTFNELPEEYKDNVFVIVRNTYDRTVSLYEKDRTIFSSKDNPIYNRESRLLEKGFKNYIKNLQTHRFNKSMRKNANRRSWIEQTQLRYLPDDIKRVKLIRFENLEKELYAYLESHGLKYKTPLKKLHATKTRQSRDYKKYYDEETKLIVKKVFAEEIKKLSYKF